MTLPKTIEVREYDKFEENSQGKTAVRTITEGSFAPSGLRNAMLITTLDIGDTATPIPASPQVNRNSVIIYNLDATKSLYIGNSDVTADAVNGTTSGWLVPPKSYFSTDVTDNIIIYGIVETGTIKVQILEVS